MIPRLHNKGKSFKGAALYLLHDKDYSSSDERVSWTHSINLATQNPDLAWRVMAATAYDQNRLKQEAGIKNTGRKSKDSILHLTLSWHPEENPSKEEMIHATTSALRALGASDHQALVICHTDEPQSHVHVVVNRISTLDGRMLPSNYEKEKL